MRALVNWAQQQSIIALSQVPTDTLGWACRTVGVCHQVLQCVVGLDAELKYTAGLVSAACFAATGPTVPSNNIAGLGLGGQLPNVLAKDL